MDNTENHAQSQTIDLFTLATHCIYATLLASKPIQELKTSSRTRTKHDGSLVTDADGAAQYIIYSQIKSLHSSLRIVGEESDLEMMHRKDYKHDSLELVAADSIPASVLDSTFTSASVSTPASASTSATQQSSKEESSTLFDKVDEIMQYHRAQNDHISTHNTDTTSDTIIDHQRVSIVVDPLDGTSSYAKGYYEAVTILVAIIVDNIPVFGVIVKPFQVGTQLPCFEKTGSSAIYGGTLIDGAFVMGEYSMDQSLSMPSIRIGNSTLSVTELKRSRLWKQKQRCTKKAQLERHRMAREASTLPSHTPCRKGTNLISPRVVKGFPGSATTSTTTSSSISFASAGSSRRIHTHGNVDVEAFTVMQIHADAGADADTGIGIDIGTDTSLVSQDKQCSQSREFGSKTCAAPIEVIKRETSLQRCADGYSGKHIDMDTETNMISQSNGPLLRAIISKSKGGGVVQKCIDSLSTKELIHSLPLYITGAGYKTMKLVLGEENEGLWFFPKPGTSLWDVAAADALLRVMGGRISDKFGKDLDYTKGRLEADNLDGIIACCDERLHETCLELYAKEKWDD